MSTRYYRILYFALAEKKKESRKSLIFRILPRFVFAVCGPTWETPYLLYPKNQFFI